MPIFKKGDYLCRDGDAFTGIIFVTEDWDKNWNIRFHTLLFSIGTIAPNEISYDPNGKYDNDRLLSLKDIEKLPSRPFLYMDSWDSECREFFRGAVLWCLSRETT